MKLANCTREIEFFRRMLQLKIEQRILLVEAPSGYGKSKLLSQFRKNCPREWQRVEIELKSAAGGVIYFISETQLQLGSERLPKYQQKIQELGEPKIVMTGNRISGNDNSMTADFHLNEDYQKILLEQLKNAFLEDLANLRQPTLLLLDTFDAAPKNLQDWLFGSFLGAAAKIPTMLVVVAGREFERPPIQWDDYHHRFELNEILDLDAWCDYATGHGYQFSADTVQAAMVLSKGLPSEVVKAFEILKRSLP